METTHALGVNEPLGASANALILRAWVEHGRPEGLRIRIIEITDLGESSLAVTANADDACETIKAWLERLLGQGPPRRATR
jgi:hypothetical protein